MEKSAAFHPWRGGGAHLRRSPWYSGAWSRTMVTVAVTVSPTATWLSPQVSTTTLSTWTKPSTEYREGEKGWQGERQRKRVGMYTYET